MQWLLLATLHRGEPLLYRAPAPALEKYYFTHLLGWSVAGLPLHTAFGRTSASHASLWAPGQRWRACGPSCTPRTNMH
jgi:hypothetical protein